MGVLASIDGQTQIIEYSDLPASEARRTQADGSLVFWAGNTAIHVFQRAFLQGLLSNELSLPFHVAHKKVTYLDNLGRIVEAEQPNAHKFERFIFDALPHAARALVVEGNRQREFNPVKNAEGNDSPETSRAALLRIAREWIEAAGGAVVDGVPVEISPLFALDAGEVAEKIAPGQTFTAPTVLDSTT
jgi:UDP-N-acetylglucosamine/UDP-N-acetylgalactosamine diphosphorylase